MSTARWLLATATLIAGCADGGSSDLARGRSRLSITGVSEGYVPPRNEQGVADAYMFFTGHPVYASAMAARYDVLESWGVGLKIYNFFWGFFEADGVASDAPIAACPTGYTHFPETAEQRVALGFHRHHCYHQAGIEMYDANFTMDAERGIQSAVVLWTAPPSHRHPDCKGSAGFVGQETIACAPWDDDPTDGRNLALEDYEDHVAYLAWRWGGTQGHGKISHYVIWNEVDSSLWFDMSPMVSAENPVPSEADVATITSYYATMMRTAHTAILRHTRGVLLHASLTSSWLPISFLAGRTHIGGIGVLEGLWRELGASIDWSVAFHAYGDPLDDGSASDVNFAELGTIVSYQEQKLRERGLDPEVHPQPYVFNSEQGWYQSNGIEYQARGICLAHDIVTQNPRLIGTTHNMLQEAPPPFGPGRDGPDSFALLRFDAGMDLARGRETPTYQAYQSTSLTHWNQSDVHYCCVHHGVGCANGPAPHSVPGRSRSEMPSFDGDVFADYADHSSVTQRFWVHRNHGDTTFAPNFTNLATGKTFGGADWDVLTGDFDGDGYADFADVLRPTGQFWVHLQQDLERPLERTFAPEVWSDGQTFAGPSNEVLVGDFDGDGRADIATRNASRGGLALSRNTGTPGIHAFADLNVNAGRSKTGPEWRTVIADFDGDGLSDYADQLLTTGEFWVHLNQGAAAGYAFSSEAWGGRAAGQAKAGAEWLTVFGDFTGDGRADYADYLVTGSLAGVFWIHESRGTSFSPDVWSWVRTTTGDEGWHLLGQP